jgi:hypothetical protein
MKSDGVWEIEKEKSLRTSRDLPYSALADSKLGVGNLDHDLARVDKEDHVILAGVLGSLLSTWRQVEKTTSKKGHRKGFCVSEVAVRNLPSLDCC